VEVEARETAQSNSNGSAGFQVVTISERSTHQHSVQVLVHEASFRAAPTCPANATDNRPCIDAHTTTQSK
jgi:hypothetical protein